MLATIIDRLAAFGWCDKSIASPAELAVVLRDYQSYWGLPVTGEPDRETLAVLESPVRFCALPDTIEFAEGLAKWGKTNLTWTIADPLPNISEAEHKDIFNAACKEWMNQSSLQLAYTPNARTADIVVTAGRIDGPNGTLAWSELPNGGGRQLTQKYDTGERWYRDFLFRVSTHELGHALGIGHGPKGCVMAPILSEYMTLQAWDIQEIRKRYPKSPSPEPQPQPPTVPTKTVINIPQAIAAGTYELRKVG